jgi:3-keto-5-aminohexanoate cleavage enzyme
MSKIIITVAVTGDGPTKEMNPAVPYTQREIADAAIESWKAGASVAHLHVRNPETGARDFDNKKFKEVIDMIRSETDMIINLSTCGLSLEGDIDYVSERRLEPIELKPEICTLDVGSVNLTYRNKTFINPPGWCEKAAARMKEYGVKPELEVFDTGHVAQAIDLIDQGLIAGNPLFTLCMGVGWGMQGTVDNLSFMEKTLPANALWSVLAVGRVQLPMVATGLLLGGNVRVGLEDNIYIRKGVLAKSNAEFVENSVELIHLLQQEVATPSESREILGLN